MDLNQLTVFRLAAQRLDYVSQRQTVLAENIANADTPGYQPQDLSPFAEQVARSARRERLAMARTDPAHLQAVSHTEVAAEREEAYEVSPSGNEVVLEQQLVAISQNAMDHQLALNLYRKQAGLIRAALGNANR